MGDTTPGQSPVSAGKRWDPELYDGRHSWVWKYGADLLELLSPRKGERILDLGCGTGHLTQQIALAGAEVAGLDISLPMIEQARKNYPELNFVLADASAFEFSQPFDAVFSNAALHWMVQPREVVACVARALNPGARFVAEFGGKGNLRALREALDDAWKAVGLRQHEQWNPWYFPSIGEYASLLEQHGLAVQSAWLFDRPTALEDGESGLRAWLEMFACDLLERTPPELREKLIQGVEERLRPTEFREGVWNAGYRRIRILARRGPF